MAAPSIRSEVNAAAGGVGLILCQWAKHLGARVIGTVGSEEKGALARAHGCAHVIVTSREDIAELSRELVNVKAENVEKTDLIEHLTEELAKREDTQ